jgi:chromosome segregation ATPase
MMPKFIDELSGQLDTLVSEITQITEQLASLSLKKATLEDELFQLKEIRASDTCRSLKQEELCRLIQAFAAHQNNLTEKTALLSQTKNELVNEAKKISLTVVSLQKTIETLSGTVDDGLEEVDITAREPVSILHPLTAEYQKLNQENNHQLQKLEGLINKLTTNTTASPNKGNLMFFGNTSTPATTEGQYPSKLNSGIVN